MHEKGEGERGKGRVYLQVPSWPLSPPFSTAQTAILSTPHLGIPTPQESSHRLPLRIQTPKPRLYPSTQVPPTHTRIPPNHTTPNIHLQIHKIDRPQAPQSDILRQLHGEQTPGQTQKLLQRNLRADSIIERALLQDQQHRRAREIKRGFRGREQSG